MPRKTSVILDAKALDAKEEVKRLRGELKKVVKRREEEMAEHAKQLDILKREEELLNIDLGKMDKKK